MSDVGNGPCYGSGSGLGNDDEYEYEDEDGYSYGSGSGNEDDYFDFPDGYAYGSGSGSTILSGEAACENRGLSNSECLEFGCCQWDSELARRLKKYRNSPTIQNFRL